MKKALKVLLTSVGSNTSVCVIKGLKRQTDFDVFIVGTDTNEKENIAGSYFCDAFYTVPPAADSKNYVDSLLKIIKLESIDLLIPINNIELEAISQNRVEIEKSTYLLLSPNETISICNDKLKMYEFFSQYNIPTPKTCALENIGKLNEIIDSGISFPFIAKPRKGIASKDVYVIRDKEDYFSIVRKIENPVVQEKVEGQEYDIDVFCDGEKMLSAVPRKRIETRAGISYKGETEKNQELIDYSRIITENLKIKGPVNIQCLKFHDEIKFIDLNPTFSGGLILAIEAGVNSPLLALKMSVGDKLEPIEDFKICKMCRYLEEIFYPSNFIR
jgi:carbamoyl-phosphate synthase large subunit